jgi:hypothetical protein
MPATQAPVREPVKCALPNCRNTFVPAHRAHIYCSATCKKRGHAYRHVLNRAR